MSAKNNVKTEKAVKSSNGFFGFLREVKVEVKRITWPSKDETKKAFIAVITFTLMYTILVWAFDSVFEHLLRLIINVK